MPDKIDKLLEKYGKTFCDEIGIDLKNNSIIIIPVAIFIHFVQRTDRN